MAAIKRFFEKKRVEAKFKLAGKAHRLDEEKPSASATASKSGPISPRPTTPAATDEARRAAEAALQRVNASKTASAPKSAIKRQVEREQELERRVLEEAQRIKELCAPPREVKIESAPVLSVNGVRFCCSVVSDESFPRAEIDHRIEQFLYDQAKEEPLVASAVMLHTFNRKQKERLQQCLETLKRYIDNVLEHPGEEKFRKIRLQNKAYQERVASCRGSEEVLGAAGFEMKRIAGPEGSDEDFWVMSEEHCDPERLRTVLEILQEAEPLTPELDRAAQVFRPTDRASQFSLPDEFYSVGIDDLRREHQLRMDAAEKAGMLRTKAMRERDESLEQRRYNYTLIRVRFPDGLILQGVFGVREAVAKLFEFVRECLQADWIPFSLITAAGEKLNIEDTKVLVERNLAPAVLLNFRWDEEVALDMLRQQGSMANKDFLKPELLDSIQSLS